MIFLKFCIILIGTVYIILQLLNKLNEREYVLELDDLTFFLLPWRYRGNLNISNPPSSLFTNYLLMISVVLREKYRTVLYRQPSRLLVR